MDRMAQQRLIKSFDLPKGTKFKGYVLSLPDTDEYLAEHQASNYADNWCWAQTPDLAKPYKKLKQVQQVQKLYTKKPTEVCYLFETPTHFWVSPVEQRTLHG